MKEIQPVKYIRELEEYFNEYGQALIEEIYIGIGIALGLSESQAYKLAEKDPKKLEKAGIFSSVFDRMKSVFKKVKIPKFRLDKKLKPLSESPLTPDEWNTINQSLDRYWQKEANRITGDVSAKAFMLGRETAGFRMKKKPYQNKSLYQVVTEQFKDGIPESIEEAYKKYDFKDSEKKILNRAFSNTAMYVTQANNDIKEGIRQIVNQGIEEGKSNTEIASDLYWGVEKDEANMNKYTAESLKRSWNRVAQTEMAMIYEAGVLASHESEAMTSIKDPSRAQYFVRTGGTCEWCRSVRGTVVRLIPSDIAADISGESLKSAGIDDANTDIAIWPGKNNVGREQKDWLIACPAHPYNVATFVPINLKTEFYNPKTDDIEKRQVKQKYVPQMEKLERPKDYRKPTKIEDGLVRVGSNTYEAVAPQDFNRKLEAWRKDNTKPIPVNTSSQQYLRIFEVAE
jgi:hypothetical protein